MAMDEWEALGDVVGGTVRKSEAVSDTSGGDEWEMLGDVIEQKPKKTAPAAAGTKDLKQPDTEADTDKYYTTKVLNGVTYRKNKLNGAIWTDDGKVVTDEDVVKAFGGTRPTKRALAYKDAQDWSAAQTADGSSAGGDLAAGWQFLKQAYAGQNFAGFDARAESHRRLAELQAKNPYLTPEQKALIASVHEREIADLTQRQAGAAVDIGAAGAAAQQYPESPAATRFNNAKTFTEAWDAFMADPYSVTRSTTLRSAAPSLPSVVGGIVGSAAGPGGAAALAGAGSGWSEFGSAVADGLQEKGAKLDDANSIMAVWKQHGPEIAQKARIRAGIIGAFDAATAGIGSKIAASPMGTVKREVAGTLVQMGGGAGGEATAEVATGEELKPGAILGEAIGELGSGAVEQGGQIAVEGLRRTFSAPGKTDLPPPQASAPAQAQQATPAKGAAPVPGAAPRAPDDFSKLGVEVSRRKGGVNTAPSEAQKAAGNYKKGHVIVQGLDITLENPKGTERSGKSPDGTEWKSVMPADYGYVKRTTGADGDQVDVFIGDDREAPQVFVIDQIDAETGNFDEHKAVAGVRSVEQAQELYAASFSDGKGRDRIGHVTTMSMDEFKTWAREGDTTKPLWGTKRNQPQAGNAAAPAQAGPPVAAAPVSAPPAPGTAKPAPRASKGQETANIETGIIPSAKPENDPITPSVKPGAAPMAVRQAQKETEKPQVAVSDPNPRKSILRRDVADDEAITTSGRKVPVKYAVVEAADLVPSQNDDGSPNPAYPAELQPRDRERRVSGAQVQDIASRLEPKLLDKSPKASDGAPIVAEDGTVESGNGRTLALRRAYERGMPGAERYRTYLKEQGYPVDGVNEPVLVRVRQGDMAAEDRQAFTREANERDTLALSAPERAMADASQMGEGVLALYRGGDVDDAGNRDFVKAFMRDVVGKNDRGVMADAEGRVSQEAVRRIGGALLAKAYGDSDLISALTESTDVNIKGIGGALLDVAGTWAQMRGESADGRVSKEVDQTKALLEAVRLVDRSRREGKPLALLVGQNDIFSGKGIAVETEFFLSLMFRDTENWKQPVSRKSLAEALRFFVGEARKTFEGTDLLGETAPRSKDILSTAKRKQTYDNEGDAADQGQLSLTRPQRTVEEDGDGDGQDAGQAGPERAAQDDAGQEAEGGAAVEGDGPEDLSPYGAGILTNADMDEIEALVGGGQPAAKPEKAATETPAKIDKKIDPRAEAAEGPEQPPPSLPEPAPAQDIRPSAYGAKNTFVTAERAAELRKRLQDKLKNQLGAGIDPEVLAMGAEMAAYHIEAGARKFGEFARAVAADLGFTLEQMRPYLRSWYNGARDMMEDNGLDVEGMESAEEVKAEMARLFGKEPAAKPAPAAAPAPAPAPAAAASEPQGDPLDRGGPWREADIVVTLDDGSKEKMNAGYAVDLMKNRIKAVSQLLECVRAA